MVGITKTNKEKAMSNVKVIAVSADEAVLQQLGAILGVNLVQAVALMGQDAPLPVEELADEGYGECDCNECQGLCDEDEIEEENTFNEFFGEELSRVETDEETSIRLDLSNLDLDTLSVRAEGNDVVVTAVGVEGEEFSIAYELDADESHENVDASFDGVDGVLTLTFYRDSGIVVSEEMYVEYV